MQMMLLAAVLADLRHARDGDLLEPGDEKRLRGRSWALRETIRKP